MRVNSALIAEASVPNYNTLQCSVIENLQRTEEM